MKITIEVIIKCNNALFRGSFLPIVYKNITIAAGSNIEEDRSNGSTIFVFIFVINKISIADKIKGIIRALYRQKRGYWLRKKSNIVIQRIIIIVKCNKFVETSGLCAACISCGV